MTDEELRLVIAEKLGWRYCPASVQNFSDGSYRRYDYISPDGRKLQWKVAESKEWIPDYPTDNNAALGLLDEFDSYDIEKFGRGYFVRIWDDDTNLFWESQNKSLPRAICEAWLTARRNNDSNT